MLYPCIFSCLEGIAVDRSGREWDLRDSLRFVLWTPSVCCAVYGNVCLKNRITSFKSWSKLYTVLVKRRRKQEMKVQSEINSQKRTSYSKSVAGLLPGSHQADIRMRSHRLLPLDDNKSAASCQQTWCKLILKTLYPQAWYKLFEQLAASLQLLSWIESYFHRLDAT